MAAQLPTIDRLPAAHSSSPLQEPAKVMGVNKEWVQAGQGAAGKSGGQVNMWYGGSKESEGAGDGPGGGEREGDGGTFVSCAGTCDKWGMGCNELGHAKHSSTWVLERGANARQ